MIIDLPKFVAAERPYWEELERQLKAIEEAPPQTTLSLEQVRRFHLLYERAASDLAKFTTFSSEPETRRYLENLISRAYGEIHETRDRRSPLRPIHWFFHTLPQTFRRHIRAFQLSLAITLVGCVFGALAVAIDSDAKQVILPFQHLMGDPAKRVAKEEHATKDRLRNFKATFSASLMTHNTQVAILVLALGMTYGVGTTMLLFYNGVILGAVALDYIRAGQTEFLLGWLMPHGVIEIPAIMIGGQAGLMLAGALIGWGKQKTLGLRMREIGPDLITLIFGVGIMLMWAGFVESFLSQYHQPVFPYWAKILLGSVELALLCLYLMRSGRIPPPSPTVTSNEAVPLT
ncbi:stage II sporulation protein M [soil metagenome]